MTEMRKVQPSLLERAASVYDFDAPFRGGSVPDIQPWPLAEGFDSHSILPLQGEVSPQATEGVGRERDTGVAPPPSGFACHLPLQGEDCDPDTAEPYTLVLDHPVELDDIAAPVSDPVYQHPSAGGASVSIDRALLTERGLLVPGAPIGALVEEFRQAKRQLMLTARTIRATDPGADDIRARTILVCSANANEGKTYCAVNLAISMAAERDTEILLVDGDIAKPDVMQRLGHKEGPGLLDALADPAIDVEACVVATDIPQLSLLPAGTRSTTDTELLASDRMQQLIARLLAADPRRIVIFDSPPALAASPASVLAGEVGQVMLVVRADKTSDGDLRQAVTQLDGCEHIQLILNAVSFAPSGRRFGSYYEEQDDSK